jgi:hypothetical protein
MLTDRIEGIITIDGTKKEVSKEHYEDILFNLDDTDRQKYKDFLLIKISQRDSLQNNLNT